MLLPNPERDLPFWVVYRQPLDFPDHAVVRVHWALADGTVNISAIAGVYTTVEEAMFDCESKGLRWIGRMVGDEPQIVGVWI